MYDLSPQASGEGSGYRETRPSNEAKEKPRWTVRNWSSFTHYKMFTCCCLFFLFRFIVRVYNIQMYVYINI